MAAGRERPTTRKKARDHKLHITHPRRRAPPTASAFSGLSRQETVGATADGENLLVGYTRLNMPAIVLLTPPLTPEPALVPTVPLKYT